MQPTQETRPQPSQRPKRRPKLNPIELVITSWAALLPPSLKAPTTTLLQTCPKRWVIYDPMVLLPSGSFTSPVWTTLLTSPSSNASELWTRILSAISTTHNAPLTHLAINEGIPLHQSQSPEENVLRSPTGLRLLSGDFGPVVSRRPTEKDFGDAFWVTARQNGITQTWAPRYTMFSRGNVTEKARVLGFESRRDGWAVDLYGGIGYFVFSYAVMGLRVCAWEINPWSVEGMRRGARMNGWKVRVVGSDEMGEGMGKIVDGDKGEEPTIVVFLEDNALAEGRVRELREGRELDVVHVNCGLLPYSTDSWRPALGILGAGEGWLHFHENVGVADIKSRREEIEGILKGWLGANGGGRTARVDHVEKVKTFAPGVGHCVFDVYVSGGSKPTL